MASVEDYAVPSRADMADWKPYDKPLSFQLAYERPSKTIDLGNNGRSAALETLGSILQLSTYHPSHGIVLASPYEQFDGSRFHDQQYVRAYRRHMLNSVGSGTPGFGLQFDGPVERVGIELQTASLATVSFPLPGGAAVVLSVRVGDTGELVQHALVSAPATAVTPVRVRYTLGLDVSVNRASYGQLTEGGPIPIPRSENRLAVHGQGAFFSVVNPHLDTHLEGCLEVDGETVPLQDLQEQITHGVPIQAHTSHWLELRPGASICVVARFCLFPHTEIRGWQQPLSLATRPTDEFRQVWLNNTSLGSFIIRRNLENILGCLAVPVSDEHVALMADHVALPLGWNRDNYWQLWFILNVRRNLDSLVLPEAVEEYRSAIDRTYRGHLLWVFRRAQRPHAFWHRSYLVNGKPKDGPVFQLDQQCYPLLELCDFHDNYPGERALVRKILAEGVPAEVLGLLWSRQDPATGLFPTEETPADDEVEYPFHFSSHVLLWYTISRIISLLQEVGAPSNLDLATLQERAQTLRAATLSNFVTTTTSSGSTTNTTTTTTSSASSTPSSSLSLSSFPSLISHDEDNDGSSDLGSDDGELVFAYLCDGGGRHRLYHDANDMPTLFAAKWDFIEATPGLGVWKNTMDWGVSEANESGYYGGGGGGRQGSANRNRSSGGSGDDDRDNDNDGGSERSNGGEKQPFAGLGSVHSPDPWTLGYFQEFMYAHMVGDRAAQDDAWRRIRGTMLFDGTFSEAVDATTGAVTSKAWFNWPGCMIGSAFIPSLKEREPIVIEEERLGAFGH